MKRVEETAAFQGIEFFSNFFYFSEKDGAGGTFLRRLAELLLQMTLIFVSCLQLSGLLIYGTDIWLLAAVVSVFSVIGYVGSMPYLDFIYGPDYKQSEMRKATSDIKDDSRKVGSAYTGYGRTNIWPTFSNYLSFVLTGIHDWSSVVVWGGGLGLLAWFNDLFLIRSFRGAEDDVDVDEYNTAWGPNIWTKWIVYILFAGSVMFVTYKDNLNKDYDTGKFVIVRIVQHFVATAALFFSQIHFGYSDITLLAASIPHPGISFITTQMVEGSYDPRILEHILAHALLPSAIGGAVVYLVLSLWSIRYNKKRMDWW